MAKKTTEDDDLEAGLISEDDLEAGLIPAEDIEAGLITSEEPQGEPKTTAAGVGGAVIRGAAKPLTQAITGGMIGGGIGGDASQALLGGAYALGGLTLTSNLAAKLIESPRFIRWVSDTTRAVVNNPNSLVTQVSKLAAIANAEPGMSDSIEAYYKQIQPLAVQMRRAR